MKSISKILLLLIVAIALLSACKSKSGPAEAPTADNRAEPTEQSEEENAPLPVEQIEPSEMVDSLDLEGEHLWNDRVALLFAPNPNHREYREMAADLAQSQAALEERDVVVYHMFWEHPGLVEETREGIPVEVAQKMRRKHAVLEDAFTFILIGKDGGQKLRSEESISIDLLTSKIDSMPMRKREMEQGSENAEEEDDSDPVPSSQEGDDTSPER